MSYQYAPNKLSTTITWSFFTKIWTKTCVFCQMTKYGIYATTPQKSKKMKTLFFHQKRLTDALPTSPQTLSHDHFSRRYGRLRLFTRYTHPGTPGTLEPRSRKMKKFKVMFFLFIYFLLFIFSKKKLKNPFFFSFFHFFGHILTTFWPENVFFPENEETCLLGPTPLIV